jgi:hypothetical protein
MRMVVAAGAVIILAGWVGAPSGAAVAKGLSELSDENPAEQPADGAKEEGGDEEGAKTEAVKQPGAASKALADKLFLSTSGGWATGSRSDGKWTASGMSDLEVGYKLVTLNKQMNVFGTYRYAPMAVAGTVDDRSYRGVWEAHFFGGRFNYQLSKTLTALASGELGYVLVHVNDTDGLAPETKVSNPGVQLAVGGGADFMLIDKWTVGPRLVVGVGGFTTVQVAAAAGFLF